MKKILTFSLTFLVVLLVGCAVSLAQLVGLAISLTAPSLCNGLTNEPVIAQLCTDLLSVLFNVDAGTIEVHSVNGQWVTLTSEPMSFDLLQSTGTPQLMVFKDVPPGRYDKIRVDMESFQIKKKDGTVITAYLPNKELIINANIVVEKKGSSVAQLNLDLAKSLHLTTEKELVFAPVIDVETKKNVAIELPNQQNQKQGTALSIAKDSKITTAAFSTATAKANNIRVIKVKGGTLVEKKRVGMDLDGKMKKDFSLDRSKQLSIQNSKVVFKEPTRNNPATSVEQQSPTGATILPPVTVSKKVISTNNIPQPKDEGFPVVVPEKQTEITIRVIDDQISLGEEASFQLSIKNYAHKTVKYIIYSLQSGQGWNVYPSPLKDRVIELRPGQEYTTTIEVAPLENLLAGIYTVGLTIVTDSEEQYQQELKVYVTLNQQDYSQVKLTLRDVDTEWKDTYGKITGFEYEVRNEGASTIKPAYFHFSVEGYNDYEKKVPVTPNLKTIFPRSTTRSLIDVPYGFAYNKAALPDPSNVKVTIVLFDENGRVIATAEKRVSLPWVETSPVHYPTLAIGEIKPITVEGKQHNLSIFVLEQDQVKLQLDAFRSGWIPKQGSFTFDSAGVTIFIKDITFQQFVGGKREVAYEIEKVAIVSKTDALAKYLTEKGVTMYTSFRCSTCTKTMDMFGSSFQYIKKVECHPQGPNSQWQLCQQKGITGTPTWILEPQGIEKKRHNGFLSLEELWTFAEEEKTYVVQATNSGFSPSALTIKAGDSVRFIAADDGRHWVASAAHPIHEAYPGSSISKCNTAERDKIFDTCHVLNKDESFQFRFTEKGSWEYHDHLHPQLVGVVIVE